MFTVNSNKRIDINASQNVYLDKKIKRQSSFILFKNSLYLWKEEEKL